MTRILVTVALIALMALSGLVARAQETPDEDALAAGRVAFDYGAATITTYELDPSVAVNACIDYGAEDASGEETVILRLFGRTLEPGEFEMLGTFPTALTADLGNHPVGYCIPLGDRS